MIERIRITLWDVFSFFLTGFFIVAVVGGFWMYQTPADFDRLVGVLSTLPASVVLVAAPLFFTLLGLLIEPFANYFDGWVLKPTLGRLILRKDRHADEEKILVAAIRKSYLGELGDSITNPFHLCKDYVEAKGLSQAFMIFLARFGFYRNCAFIAVGSGVYAAVALPGMFSKIVGGLVALAAAYIFKRRAEDFYSYQAPAVYRAFLIDKLKWVRDGAA